MYKIYSLRFSIAQGNHWKYERDCKESDIHSWLAIFEKDEPDVLFLAAKRKPKAP